MAQAIDALNNLIKEGTPMKTTPKIKKYRLIRALMGMKHSPAGKRHLAREKKDKLKGTQPVYFKHIRRKSDAQRLIDAGLSKDELKSLGIKQ